MRRTLFKSIQQQLKIQNLWILEPDLSNLEPVVADAAQRVQSQLIPWFQAFGSPKQLLRFFLESEEKIGEADNTFGFGRKGSPIRNVITGFTALEAREYAIAREFLSMCVDNRWLIASSGSHELNDQIKAALDEARLAPS